MSTAVANVHVSMDEKVSLDLHGTTAASLSAAFGEAQFSAGLDDEVLYNTDAGPLQLPARCDHREVSTEFNRLPEEERRLQEQRRTSKGHGLMSTGSYCMPKNTHTCVHVYTRVSHAASTPGKL